MIQPMKILGVPVHPMTMQGAVDELEKRMLAGEQTFVVTANAEIIMMCQENAEYNKIVCENAELVLPDGAGAVWAGRHLGYTVPERVAGFDLYNHLLDLSAHKGYKAYFFGGAPGVAEAAKTKSEELYPGVQVVGCHNGYFKPEDEAEIIADINASGADMLFVALGAPKQEIWLKKYRDQLKPRILMGIGGSFAGDSLVFRNPDGGLVLELYNPFDRIFTVEFQNEGNAFRFDLEPKSINSIVIS